MLFAGIKILSWLKINKSYSLSSNKQNMPYLCHATFLLTDLKHQKCKYLIFLLVFLGSCLLCSNTFQYVYDFCEVEIPVFIENKICGNSRICCDWLSLKETLGFPVYAERCFWSFVTCFKWGKFSGYVFQIHKNLEREYMNHEF